MNNNPIYDDSHKYAQNAMRDFSGLSIPEHVRGLIQTHIEAAYIRGNGDAYRELRAVLRLWASKETALDALNLPFH